MNAAKLLVVGCWLLPVAVARPAPAAQPPAATAPATGPVTRPVSPRVAELIRQLESDSWREREAAQVALMKLDEEARAGLEEVLGRSADQEVRMRAAAALRAIGENRKIGPTLVTLHLKDATVEAAVKELGKQAGTEFGLYPPTLGQELANQTVSIDADRQPLLAVLKDLCTQAGLSFRTVYDPQKPLLMRGAGAPMSGPGIVQGPFLIGVAQVRLSAQHTLAGPAQAYRECAVNLALLTEPKIGLLSGRLDLEEARDEAGGSLLMDGASYPATFYGAGSMRNLDVRLKYPPRTSTRIAMLKGTLRLMVELERETMEVDDILNVRNLEKEAGGERVTIKGLTKQGEEYRLEMTVHARPGSPAWRQFPGALDRVRLVDAQNRPLYSSGGGGSGGGDGSYPIMRSFRRANYDAKNTPGEPVKLVWEVPVSAREVVVPVEFTDIPLP